MSFRTLPSGTPIQRGIRNLKGFRTLSLPRCNQARYSKPFSAAKILIISITSKFCKVIISSFTSIRGYRVHRGSGARLCRFARRRTMCYKKNKAANKRPCGGTRLSPCPYHLLDDVAKIEIIPIQSNIKQQLFNK